MEQFDRGNPTQRIHTRVCGAGLLRFTAKGIHEVIAHSLTHLCASGRVPSHACTSNMSATLIGASLGFGMQLYINALRKLPLLRSECRTDSPALHWPLARASLV